MAWERQAMTMTPYGLSAPTAALRSIKVSRDARGPLVQSEYLAEFITCAASAMPSGVVII